MIPKRGETSEGSLSVTPVYFPGSFQSESQGRVEKPELRVWERKVTRAHRTEVGRKESYIGVELRRSVEVTFYEYYLAES